ncbi:FAD-dependent oxidoreductase [Pontiellaceae bacterium B1224]|nr:FAD-dependent oxidoreductase [Pontiellaceae bacterium B1224]
MNNLSRRHMMQQAGLGLGLAGATTMLGPSRVDAVTPSQVYASLPVLDEIDVLVCGGGAAGIGAGMAAAQQGARTLVIENCTFFGGVISWMVGMEMNQMRPKGMPRSDTIERLIKQMESYGPQSMRFLNKHAIIPNVEYFKVAVLDCFDAVNCDYLVGLRAADAIVEDNVVKGVVVATRQGLMRINAQSIVDCTGDADIAHYAGAETWIYDEGMLGAMTLGSNYNHWQKLRKTFAGGRDKYPLLPKVDIIRQVAGCDFSFLNNEGSLVLGNRCAVDLKQRTETETQLSRQLVQNVRAMREFGDTDELKNAELVGAAQQVATRESRRLHGEYTLTMADIESGTTHPDTVAWRTGGIDVGPGGLYKPNGMNLFDIPYRSLLPIKVDGLIVAGRCISADHIPSLSGKSIGNQFAAGQGAGTAAAVAAKRGVLPRKIDVGEVQAILAKDNVDLFPANRSTRA